MTNVDFFEDFAADTTTVTSKNTEYYFEHSREDFANLFDAESEDDDQIKMFHYTTDINVKINESGEVIGVTYTGEILALLKSDIDEVIHGQKGIAREDSKYEKRVKALIEDGGIIAEIVTYNNCNTERDYELTFSGMKEIYNGPFDWNADGVFFTYELYIPV